MVKAGGAKASRATGKRGAEGKAAVVTGGGHGIGRAIAETLAARDYAVTVIDRRKPDIPWPAPVAGAITFLKADVASEPQLRAAIQAAIRRHGRLDALVNNAGIMIRKPFQKLTMAEWNRVLATNLTAAFVSARAAADALRASGDGAIVNIASTRALMSEPDTEAYAATKGGLVALTHALAISLGPKVRVNCISPGWIDVRGEPLSRQDHAQHPVGRVGRPQDIAELAAYLLSNAAGFVTGVNFIVDGGMTRKMIYVE